MQNFRVSIRRQQIDRIFQDYRSQKVQEQGNEDRQKINQKLSTQEERDTWIRQKALIFAGEPQKSWSTALNNLLHAVLAFEYEHSQWLTLGIIKAITNLLMPEYEDLGLSKVSVLILSDIIYINQTTDPKIIKQILSYDCVDHLIRLLFQNHCPEYLKFLSAISRTVPDLRDYLRERGCLDLVIGEISGPLTKTGR